MENTKEQKYERTNLVLYKAKNKKSVTIPISSDEYMNEIGGYGTLIINVSIAGLLKFLQDENWTKFKLNKIVED
jgi:hypothetical protein